jgi:putative hydrolase of the HAD superfamily
VTAPPASPTQVVVFDIDDTLYLERDYVRSGFRAAGAWADRVLGVADLADRAWKAFEEGVRGTIFDVALADCGCAVTPELITQLVSCYRDHVPDIKLLDDARACLDRLSLEGGVVVAVVTDGPLASQEAKARSLGLSTWSQHVIFTEALGAGFGKPNPRAFELIEQRLGVSGDRCAYVADNPSKDFVGPHQLGWTTLRVRRQHGLHFGVESGGDVDYEVADLSEPLGLLGRARR